MELSLALTSIITIPSPPSSHRHIPDALRRDFLGSCSQLRPTGYFPSRRRCRNSVLQSPSLCCQIQDSVLVDPLLVFTFAVAGFTSIKFVQQIYTANKRCDVADVSKRNVGILEGQEGDQLLQRSHERLLMKDQGKTTKENPNLFAKSSANSIALQLVHAAVHDDGAVQANFPVVANLTTTIPNDDGPVQANFLIVANLTTTIPDIVPTEYQAAAAVSGRSTNDAKCQSSELGVAGINGRQNVLLKHNRSQLSSGSYKRPSPALRLEVSAQVSSPTSEYGRRYFAAAPSQGRYRSRDRESFIARSLTKDIGYSLMPTSDNKKTSAHTRTFVNNTRPAYLRTYNNLLQDSRLSNCIDLLEDMQRKGLLNMDKISHTKFLKVCKNHKAVKEAFHFVRLITKPTISTFNMLLTVCAHSRDFEGAFEVMLLVKKAGLKPDCKLYTTLISTCGKSGKVDAMFEVFHEMVNAGVEPTVNTYGALIDGCARAGQVAKAFGAYGIMSSKKVQPDRVVFNALITACGQSGAVDRAFDVLAEMMAEPKPIEPDHVTVGALMKTCIQAGQVSRAREVYKMLDKYNIKGTTDVYTIAVSGCSQTGDLDFALSIYEDMTRKGVAPDEMFLSTLVDVAGHAGNADVAFQILNDARRKGIRLGNMSYSSSMGACCNAKDWQKGLKLFEEIKAVKLLPTVSTLNALITALCDGDQLSKSIEVLHEMKDLGVRPNIITYSVLLVACEKKHEAELAFTLLQEAKEDGILPNLIMCKCLIGLCLKSFEQTKSFGESVVFFNAGRPQIDNKWTSRAIMAYRETIAAGVIPTMEVFSQVLGCLKFPSDASLKDTFFENLGISIDVSKRSSISSLLDGFGEYDTRSFSVLEEAASLKVLPRVSFKESPIVVDARKLQIHSVEVYVLTILKGLKHRLAAGARLPNITILLPIEKTRIGSEKSERTINLAGRVGQAVGSLLRRLGLPYHGDESYGKIRINGLTLRRWFRPKLDGPSPNGKSQNMLSVEARLSKGIADQQRNIRNSYNLE